MRDGLLLQDHLVSQRTNAATQLQQPSASTVQLFNESNANRTHV